MNAAIHNPSAPQRWQGVRTLLIVLLGPIVWASHLMLTYGVQSVVCAITAQSLAPVVADLDIVQLAILVLSALGLLLVVLSQLAIQWLSDRFLRRVASLLALLSVLAIVAAGSTMWILPTCASLR